jgi:dolichol-phosphate mannosyltransferase
VTIVDIVVAVRNEELTIPRFIDEVRSLRLPEGVRTRILFVEDGSTDQTLDLLRSQSRHDPSIQYYSLTNPFGQVGALSMGLAHASGDAVIMMDVDGSRPVDILPEMIAEFLAGADIVQGVRLVIQKRAPQRRLGSWCFNGLIWVLTGFQTSTQNVYFRLVSLAVCKEIIANPRNLRFLRITFIDRANLKARRLYFTSEARRLGQSKYDLRRLALLSIDAVLSVVGTARFAAWMVVCVGVATVLWRLRYRPAAFALLAFVAAAVTKFALLCREDILGKLKIVEHS